MEVLYLTPLADGIAQQGLPVSCNRRNCKIRKSVQVVAIGFPVMLPIVSSNHGYVEIDYCQQSTASHLHVGKQLGQSIVY